MGEVVSVAGEVIATKPKHAGGAPTLYRPEYCEQIVEYFESKPLRLRTLTSTSDSVTVSTAKQEARAVCSEVPTFQGFAAAIGVSVATLTEWGNRHPEFSAARARAKQIQEDFFAQGLSTGIMNPTGAIFVAKNILGWRDKIDIDTGVTADHQDAQALRDALSAATPAQLAQFGELVRQMQGQIKPGGTAE